MGQPMLARKLVDTDLALETCFVSKWKLVASHQVLVVVFGHRLDLDVDRRREQN
jgi:hypothetical protein